jgi:hypothetical protein
MRSKSRPAKSPYRLAALIRRRIEQGGERLWRLKDFADFPPATVATALSRMTKEGVVRRLSNGTYYRPRQGAFGETRPNPAAVRDLAARKMFPAGIAAANILGFTTQNAKRNEIATAASSLPRKLVGDAVIKTRRPEAWNRLNETEAALLEFLRARGRYSELPAAETIRRTLRLLSKEDTFARLARAAKSEPPRVRAMLGALGEAAGMDGRRVKQLRSSLSPYSKFDFGVFAALPDAAAWQAKGTERRAPP